MHFNSQITPGIDKFQDLMNAPHILLLVFKTDSKGKSKLWQSNQGPTFKTKVGETQKIIRYWYKENTSQAD